MNVGVQETTYRAEGGTNLSAVTNIGLGIALDANGRAVLAGAAGADFVGGLMDGGRAAGEPVRVAYGGIVRAIAGGALNEGDFLTTEAGGRFVQATVADTYCGKCVQRGGAADLDVFDMLLVHGVGSTAAAP